MNNLANLLSILSLASGFISIIFSLESHFTFACWAIIISVIFDGLDGQIARKNSISSELGKELDSLIDVISFGIAPAILGYIFVYQSFYLGAAIALFIYLLCSVIRLAEYNLTPKERLAAYFYGLPTTASGGLLASFILIYRKYTQFPPPVIFLAIVLLLAFLMVSKVKYPNLDSLKRIFNNRGRLFPAVALIALVLVPEIAIFMFFLVYLIFSPFLIRKFV